MRRLHVTRFLVFRKEDGRGGGLGCVRCVSRLEDGSRARLLWCRGRRLGGRLGKRMTVRGVVAHGGGDSAERTER